MAKKQKQAEKQPEKKYGELSQDVQREGESDWDYRARRAKLSNDGSNSSYAPGPVDNLVQQFRGKP